MRVRSRLSGMHPRNAQQHGSPGITPLHLAAWVGNDEAGRALIGTGKVHIDFKDRYGNTALHYASLRGHTDFLKMCVSEFKASVLIPNNANELVMEVAQTRRLSLRPLEGAASEAYSSVPEGMGRGRPLA